MALLNSGCGCSGWHEFVPRNLRGDSRPAIFGGFDAHNFPLAPNVDVAGLCYLLRKRNHEIDLVSNLEVGFCKKVQSLIAQVSSMRFQFVPLCFAGQHTQRKVHVKSPRFTAFRSITHQITPAVLGFCAKLAFERSSFNAKIQEFCPSTRSCPSRSPKPRLPRVVL